MATKATKGQEQETAQKPARRSGKAPRWRLETVLKAGAHPGLILGLAVEGKRVVAVGGQGHDLLLTSKDGASFATRDSEGRGLRAALIRRNGELLVVGEYGHVAVSRDQGKSWEKVFRVPRPWYKGQAPCLFGIVEDDEGNAWAAGDSGYLGKIRPGSDRIEPVRLIEEYMGRITTTPLGLLAPTDDGHLFVVKKEQADKLRLNAKVTLMMARVTPAGSIIVVGLEGALYQSSNQGKKFQKIETPEPVMLTGIDCLESGRVLVVGEKGTILISDDDGQTFSRVKNGSKRTLWCCLRWGAGALIGGEDGLLLRYVPS